MADQRNDMEKRLNDFGLSSACVPRHYAIGVCQSLIPHSESHAIDRRRRTKVESIVIVITVRVGELIRESTAYCFAIARPRSHGRDLYVNARDWYSETPPRWLPKDVWFSLSPASPA